MLDILGTILFFILIVLICAFLIFDFIVDYRELQNLKKYSEKLDLQIEKTKEEIREIKNGHK